MGSFKRVMLGTALGAAAMTLSACVPEAPTLPKYDTPKRTVWMEQGWADPKAAPKPDPAAYDRNWYYHASQGTLTFGIPYEWFMALEQPDFTLWETGLLSDPAYLDRVGFIIPPDNRNAYNPDGLPVGFSKGAPIVDPTTGQPFMNPATGKPLNAVGLTCAACHTGQLEHKGTRFIVDGGAALTDLGKFRTALGISIGLTASPLVPGRFDRFAERVLGANHTKEAKAALNVQLQTVLAKGQQLMLLDQQVGAQSVAEGFGRLDALNRIGNQVFSIDLALPQNYAPTNAPVNYPHIWSTSWYDWVQYNGSIEQPMVRNAGEAMGVAAPVNMTGMKTPLFTSSLPVREIYEMEEFLAGPEQPFTAKRFTGLRAPAWPKELPAVNAELAKKGEALYGELCQGCHLPPPGTDAFWNPELWSDPKTNAAGWRYLKMKMVDISYVGTDPAQAKALAERKVAVPDYIGLSKDAKTPDEQGRYWFGPALGEVVEKVVTQAYNDAKVPMHERPKLDGYRPNGIRAPLQYKARPLDGVWATAPYLHNGSVPTLYALLSPVNERPASFWLGNREYDPKDVGYVNRELEGGFKVRTDLPGNLNTGHEFKDGPLGNGVIGRYLAPEERRALVEYLKTL